MTLEAVPLALVIDAVTGEPPRLWSRVGHPVAWMGAVIDRLDGALNAGRRRDGVVALALATTAFAVPAALVAGLVGALPAGIVIEAALASTLLAHRSLHDHVAAVKRARTPAEAREAVARIVGRDTATLDEAGVARAALETLGENLSDGVVAPAFWFALGGLPGLVAYKVVSTADSMIGHRTPRHEAFGWAAARADDALNLAPARLTALAIALVRPAVAAHARTVRDGARRHASPNAGWPEAAFAAALGVALGGPRRYGAREVGGVWLNPAGRPPRRTDIRRGLRASRDVGIAQLAIYAGLAFL